MRLFITTEGQVDMRNEISEIDKKLEFVTAKDKGLEDIDNYGTEFKTLYIIPTISSGNLIELFSWKEIKLVCSEKKDADIRLFMDGDKYWGNKHWAEKTKKRKLLFVKAIIDSIDVVIEKSKGDFRGEELKRDILKALKVKKEKLDRLSLKADIGDIPKEELMSMSLKTSIGDIPKEKLPAVIDVETLSFAYGLANRLNAKSLEIYKAGAIDKGDARLTKEFYDNTNTTMVQLFIAQKEKVHEWAKLFPAPKEEMHE